LASQKHNAPTRSALEAQDRSAIAVTVVWMLATFSCAAAQVVALVMWLVARSVGIPAGQPNALGVVAGILQMVAMLTGLLVLVLTPFAYRVGHTRPPRLVTIGAIIVALMPLVTIAVGAVLD
jgi:hypothetical protein